jgi:hypothetical protein
MSHEFNVQKLGNLSYLQTAYEILSTVFIGIYGVVHWA